MEFLLFKIKRHQHRTWVFFWRDFCCRFVLAFTIITEHIHPLNDGVLITFCKVYFHKSINCSMFTINILYFAYTCKCKWDISYIACYVYIMWIESRQPSPYNILRRLVSLGVEHNYSCREYISHLYVFWSLNLWTKK